MRMPVWRHGGGDATEGEKRALVGGAIIPEALGDAACMNLSDPAKRATLGGRHEAALWFQSIRLSLCED